MSEQLTDLARKFDRASYDLAKSLVKLDEAQKVHLPIEPRKTETLKYLSAIASLVEQIATLEALQDDKLELKAGDLVAIQIAGRIEHISESGYTVFAHGVEIPILKSSVKAVFEPGKQEQPA